MLCILDHHARAADAQQLDPMRIAQQLNGGRQRLGVELVAQGQCRRRAIGQHLAAQVGHRIRGFYLRMRDRDGAAGQAGSELELEIGQPLHPDRTAKPHHRRLADADPLRDFNNRQGQHRARIFQHPIGHPALGRADALAHLADMVEHRRTGIGGLEFLGQNRRNPQESRVFGGNDVSRNLHQII